MKYLDILFNAILNLVILATIYENIKDVKRSEQNMATNYLRPRATHTKKRHTQAKKTQLCAECASRKIKEKKQAIDIIISKNNRAFTVWGNKIRHNTAKMRKIRKDRDKRGIAPDPALIKALTLRLIKAGILDKDGNPSKNYYGED